VRETDGRPTVLVTIAGIYCIASLVRAIVEDWKSLIDVNATEVFLGMKHCTPLMREQGDGSIVNLSSAAGLMGLAGHASYAASNGAVRAMTKDAAIELAEDGIRVNSIHPAYIDTRMAEYGAEAQGISKKELKAMHLLGPTVQPDDVAYAVVYLGFGESTFLTGAELVCDGGIYRPGVHPVTFKSTLFIN